MIRKLLLLLGLVLFSTGVTAALANNLQPSAPTYTPVVVEPLGVTHPIASEVATLVNNERVKAGELPLIDDPRLDASAAAKCADEDTKNYHAHVAPDGTSWVSFIKAQTYYNTAGENLSWNYPTSKGAVDGWMGSPPHRAAILNTRFTHAGYAVCGIEGNNSELVEHFKG